MDTLAMAIRRAEDLKKYALDVKMRFGICVFSSAYDSEAERLADEAAALLQKAAEAQSKYVSTHQFY